MAALDHICRICGHGWFSNRVDETCELCGSGDIQDCFDEDDDWLAFDAEDSETEAA